MTAAGTIEQLAGELALIFDPLARRVEEHTTDSLLPWLGLRPPDGASGAGDLATAIATTAAAASGMPKLIAELVEAVDAEDGAAAAAAAAALLQSIGVLITSSRDIADALQELSVSSPALTPQQQAELSAFAGQFTERLLSHLLAEYLEHRFPQIALVLLVVGGIEIVEEEGGPAGSLNAAHTRKTFRFDRLAKLVTDPEGLLKDVYGWGESSFDGIALFRVLQTILDRKFRIPAQILQPPGGPAVLEAFGFSAAVNDTPPMPGLDLSLRFPLAVTRTDTIAEGDWQVAFTGAAALDADLDATITPPFDLQVDLAGATVAVGLSATFSRVPTAPPFLILGEAAGSRLELQSPVVGAGLDIHLDAGNPGVSLEPSVEVGLRGGKLVISGGGGDSFIATLLSSIQLESAFEIDLTWSPSTGVVFQGSVALEIAIPSHVALGPLEITTLYLRAGLKSDGSIPIELSCAFKAALGPLNASVDRLGVNATFTFPKSGGNLGPADVAFGFKPPSGVGLSIDTGVVKGGGFLYLDFEKGEYAGAIELTIAGFLSLKAIGLINTVMPGGQPGFALLIIITAEFSPGFQLGFGFSLIGVGGLLGLNRAVLIDPLAQGVRTGAVSSILFPTNIVANAPKILSDLRAIFPPEQGTFVIGPMAKVGWGTPTLVSIALGVIIEIPGGDVVILGRLGLTLPTEEAKTLLLQVSFIGVLEFSKRRLWFFATLFESRILFITLEGEMGLLMDYGDQPNFVLSVGGFHPRFTAPPLPFPSPARVALTLVHESWARVRAETYFAVTSNSVQIGCRLEAFFGFDSLAVTGDFSFDALLRFSPFYLIIELSAGFSVKVFGIGLFSVRLRGSLEGPTPWHIQGSAEISLLFFSVSVDVDVTFGERRAETLPPIVLLPKMREEFEKLESWRATLPASGQLFVSLRELGTSDALVLHPVGTLQISQRFAPVNLTLEKIGNQRPSDVKRITVGVQSAGLAVKGPTREKFAAAQYREMSDAAKLSAPAYEPLDSGVELGAAGSPWATGPAAQRNVRYEMIVLDTALEATTPFFVLPAVMFAHFQAGASVSRSEVSLANERRKQPFAGKVSVGEEQYTVAWQADNRPYTGVATFGSHAEAQSYMADAVRAEPGLAETIHVIPGVEVNQAA